jgi:hypothetical protein
MDGRGQARYRMADGDVGAVLVLGGAPHAEGFFAVAIETLAMRAGGRGGELTRYWSCPGAHGPRIHA